MTSVLLVTYNTVGASIQGVTELKVKLKDHVCTLLDADKEKYGQTCKLTYTCIIVCKLFELYFFEFYIIR